MAASLTSASVSLRHAKHAARQAGLRHVTDEEPGIRRTGHGKRIAYVHPSGRPVKDAATLARIRRLAIPPAWTDVWICRDARGHIQATGRDARGRKQYRYHARWREVRDETKYHRMIAFGQALPRVRQVVEEDLQMEGLPREKVLATIVRLMDMTSMRVGNHEYRRANGSHGLTTLQDHHAHIGDGKVTFRFRGKSGKDHVIDVEDPFLARIVQHCRDLPGQELFQYVDAEGSVRDVTSTDVNAYLREITNEEFTAKDFRTWSGTVLAAVALREVRTYDTQAEAKRNVVKAIERVAKKLGNTPAVCRKCYVHPAVLDSYLDGTFVKLLRRDAAKVARAHLDADEAAVLALLRRRLALQDDPKRLEKQLAASLRSVGTHRGRKAKGRRPKARPAAARAK